MIASILAITFFLLFSFSTFLLIRTVRNSLLLIDKIDDLEEQLELSLEILNEKHKRLEAKSKLEIFFDDPVIKETVKDIADSKDIISKIINNFDKKEEQTDQTQ